MIVKCPCIKGRSQSFDSDVYYSIGKIPCISGQDNAEILSLFLDILGWMHTEDYSYNNIVISEIEYLVILDNNETLANKCIGCITSQMYHQLLNQGFISKELLTKYIDYTGQFINSNKINLNGTNINELWLLESLAEHDSVTLLDIQLVVRDCYHYDSGSIHHKGLEILDNDILSELVKGFEAINGN